MMRFVIIIIFIMVGYFILRYLIRTVKQEVYQRGRGKTEEEYRQVLGIADNDSPATLRMKYKELLVKYHPDKVHHLGIEFQEMAEKKTRVIMEAYEFFRKKYKI
jgi:preprotein translocase subunit Sec63